MALGKMGICTAVVAAEVGSYGWTREAFWRPKEGQPVIGHLYARDGLSGTAYVKGRPGKDWEGSVGERTESCTWEKESGAACGRGEGGKAVLEF